MLFKSFLVQKNILAINNFNITSKKEVVWGSWVQIRKVKEVNMFKLTCSPSFIHAYWFSIFSFSLLYIAAGIKIIRKEHSAWGIAREMWEQKETMNLSSSYKKNTPRIMGGSCILHRKFNHFFLGWYFLDSKKYL